MMKYIIRCMALLGYLILSPLTYADNTSITWAQEQGIIADSSDLGTTLSKAEAAQLFLNLVKQQRPREELIELLANPTQTCQFDDIQDHPYTRTITTLCALGVNIGSGSSYNPDQKLSPKEGIITLAKIFAHNEDTQQFNDQSYLDQLISKGIITQSELEQLLAGDGLTTSQLVSWTYNITHPTTDTTPTDTNSTGDTSGTTQPIISNPEPSTGATTTSSGSTSRDSDIVVPVDTAEDIIISGASLTGSEQHVTSVRPFQYTWNWLKWLLLAALIGLIWQLRKHRNDGHRDDLTIIEGIGPKVQNILHINGVETYEELARLTNDDIHDHIDPYGDIYKQMNVRSRSHQAKLASEKRRQELEALKEELIRGS